MIKFSHKWFVSPSGSKMHRISTVEHSDEVRKDGGHTQIEHILVSICGLKCCVSDAQFVYKDRETCTFMTKCEKCSTGGR